MFFRKNILLFILFVVYLFLSSSVFGQLPPLTPGWETTKRGGVAFRVGGNQPIAKYIQYDSLFKAKSTDLGYDYHFGFAMWLGNSEFDLPAYRDNVIYLQSQGHDLYDLTPNNRINYFITKFTEYNYSAESGVDHVDGTKICLKFGAVDLTSFVHSGTADININTITGTGFNQIITKNEYYLYFGAPLDTLVLINNIESDTQLTIKDFWADNIDLETVSNVPYYSFDFKDIHMTPEALVLLGKETLKLVNLYDGIERPYRFIVPGTSGTPWGTTTDELQPTIGVVNGYISSQTYFDYSLKTYNEYNPSNTNQFGMTWGQFEEEKETIEQIKAKIADGIAKHFILFNHGHFKDNYFANTADILQWCHDKNIPVLTDTDWTTILYNTTPNASVNIFPPLNVDLDGNGAPDGYESISTLDAGDGPSGLNHSLLINQLGPLCNISKLGGVEKGPNHFEIWTKGPTNSEITVTFSIGGSNTDFVIPAGTSSWTKYEDILSIPGTINIIDIDITCTTYGGSGDVKIGGMVLGAGDLVPVELTSFTVKDSGLGVELDWTTATEVNNYGFEIERNLSQLRTSMENVIDTSGVESSEWMTIGFVEGHGNSYSPKEYSFIDTSSLSGDINYRLKQIDTDGKFEYSQVETISLSIVSVPSSNEMLTNLDQNHPNPFNPSTIISYQLKDPVNVTIRVYDIIGNKVATLIKNQKQSAGSHSIEFNSYDYNNLSSGVYFYQILAGQYVDTKKMLLLK